MDEVGGCPYCHRTFRDSSELWDHINNLTCESGPLPSPAALNDVPSLPPSPPPRSSDSTISQPEKRAADYNLVPERMSATVPSSEFHNGDNLSFDMNAIRTNLPSVSRLPQSGSQSTKPVTSELLNKNLFSKKEFPTLESKVSSEFSQPPKWKCTLCDVEFAQKQAMIAHVRSAEHEARISSNATSAGDCSQSLAQPKPPIPVIHTNDANATNMANTCSKEGDLVLLIRQIVREELRSIFQPYFDGGKKPNHSPPLPSNNMQTENYDTKFIQINGQFIRCEACNCSVSSLANLSPHVAGKRHRISVAKLTALGSHP
ncbi:unnamed protein product [Rodentolepis nana]|uniref:C2H2-type domain-containing protein n=1 Tax=Rodentolepis nana TaxID=102285 RepID=A0A0R3T8J1_RODNA|nr:unnamed protein product [Rodentolepis nana]